MELFGKKEMVDAIAAKFDMTKVKAGDMYDFIMATAASQVAKGNRVALRGLGTLKIKSMSARVSKSFGKTMNLPARKRVVMVSKVQKA